MKHTAPFFALLFEKPGRSFTRVTALAHERPRRLVIGHVLLRGHARNCRTIVAKRRGAANHRASRARAAANASSA